MPARRLGGPRAVLVNQRLARRHWPETDPIGRRISTDRGRTWRTITGVVGDVRQASLDREPQDAVYLLGLFAAAAVAGCLLPARRATAVSPLTALRTEA